MPGAKGYIIGHVTVTNPQAYGAYVERDTPILESYGARFIVRAGRSIAPEGPMKERHVVMEFPSFEAAKSAYYSEEYQAIVGIRFDNAQSDIVIVEGT